MGNIIRYLRQSISKVSPELSEFDAKQTLLSKMQTFLDEKMLYAADSITNCVSSTINEDDVILTFGSSPLLRRIFLKIAQTKKFQLIVVDTRPLNEGLQTLAALSQCIKCIYSPLSGIAVALHNVNKVVLGASCLLSNGSMLAPAGTAMVASMATALQIPVLVACESYKFSDKVQLDPIVFNELGHASEIAVMVSAAEAQEYTGNEPPAGQEYVALPQTDNKYRGSADKASLLNQLSHNGGGEEYVTYPYKSGVYSATAHNVKLPYQVVNLRYDLTPLTNISVVATETGLIPPTSVPVLIREIQSDAGGEM
jgi:translation initiation factor eIF-2B subunit delta